MPTLTILGLELEVRGLTPLELTRWNTHLMLLATRLHWTELYDRVDSLPGRLQEVVFANSRVPEKLNRQQYFDLATRLESVNFLVSMIVDEPSELLESLTAETAPEIFWALQPLILNKPIALSGGEALAKLSLEDSRAEIRRVLGEESDAGSAGEALAKLKKEYPEPTDLCAQIRKLPRGLQELIFSEIRRINREKSDAGS